MQEQDLYGPVKAFLTGQGFAVKGEVNGCDLVAVRGEDLLVVELKRSFTLGLVYQGIRRQAAAGIVYLAVAAPRRWRDWQDARGLCRRLGLGLLVVRSGPPPAVEVLCDPGPFVPRHSPQRRLRLLQEFRGRGGDYNAGGSARRPLVTVYREQALRVAACLRRHGPSRVAAVRRETGVARAGAILRDNVYGWFARTARGVYALTPAGAGALSQWAHVLSGEAGDGGEGAAGAADRLPGRG